MGTYLPPGISVQQTTSTLVTPVIALPGNVCLVGPANGFITRTDAIQLVGNTATLLTGIPRDQSGNLLATLTGTGDGVTLVMDAFNPSLAPSGFSGTTDYQVNTTTGSITRRVTTNTTTGSITAGATTFTLTTGATPSAGQIVRLTNTGLSPVTETATVLSLAGQVVTVTTPLVNSYATGATAMWGNIPDGDLVYATYSYTPNDYFNPIELTTVQDVENRFGPAWDPTGVTISSPLSYAAVRAFEAGANSVVLQPLYFLNNGVPQQPTATQIATASTWQTVYQNLDATVDGIGLLTPVIGQSTTNMTDSIMYNILSYTQDFIWAAANPAYGEPTYIVAVMGEDSSASNTQAVDATIQAHGAELAAKYNGDAAQQCVLLNTSNFQVASPKSTTIVGGQYVAATIAGQLASQSPANALTRQPVPNVLAVTDRRNPQQQLADGQSSLLVLENKNGIVQVRHGITLDSSSVINQELNVVRAKHFIIESVAGTLDTEVIGKIPADTNAPTLVNNLVIGTLEELLGQNIMSSYDNVASQITSLNPTQMAVQFSYVPLFMINYVTILYTLDFTNQSISVDTSSS